MLSFERVHLEGKRHHCWHHGSEHGEQHAEKQHGTEKDSRFIYLHIFLAQGSLRKLHQVDSNIMN